MEPLFDALALTALLNEAVVRWHSGPISNEEQDPFLRLVLASQSDNFQIWHEEDKARDPAAAPEAITQVKRNIDRLNQQRNDAMERLDEYVLEQLGARGVQAGASAPLHSESVGSIVDRLAILALKIYHMREESRREDVGKEHVRACAEKLAVLEEQQTDLAGCLAGLQESLCRGQTRFKVYRQMKMYNDPALNPVLYGKGGQGSG